MLAVALAAAAVAVVAGVVYLGRERLGIAGVALTALRTIGLTALVILLLNPVRAERVPRGTPIILLDESLSMAAPGGKWRVALDTARAIAGADGTILRFGARVRPFDTLPPTAGFTRLREALRAGRASGGSIYVVTDGEIEDIAAIPPNLLNGVTPVLLPRDTLIDAALLDVDLPDRVQRDDSIPVTLVIGTWGRRTSDEARVEVFAGERRLLVRDLELPPSPGVARRSFALEPRLLPAGTHILRFRVSLTDDELPGDDERTRVLTVSQQPAIVVLVSPSDWEGRFLVSELSEVAGTSVSGYARVGPATWLDMRSLAPVPAEAVQGAARRSGLLVVRGGRSAEVAAGGTRRPVWRWPAASDTAADFFAGDWYLTGGVPASPLAGRLGRIEWDSLPPLTGLMPLASGRGEWVAVSARRGRRGAERPVLVGKDSAGVRELTTAGAGLWRWRFRGGAAREAYRALLAAGTDWLLGSEVVRRPGVLTSSSVVVRGQPIMFRWVRDSVPDSLTVTISRDGAGDEISATLRFDGEGNAVYQLPPGVYRWFAPTAGGVRGLTVVEQYSDEYHPRMVTTLGNGGAAALTLIERYARENWWLFAIVVLALTGEWAWRHRRGLP